MARLSVIAPPSHTYVPYCPKDPFDDGDGFSDSKKQIPSPQLSRIQRNVHKPTEDWLNASSNDPYVELLPSLLSRINLLLTRQNSIWIKYQRLSDGRQLSGGVLVRSEAPIYVVLRNPYTQRQFSVQLCTSRLYVLGSVRDSLSSNDCCCS